MRQRLYTHFDPRRGFSIASLAYEYAADHRVAVHAHGSHQLIYAISGLMEVTVDRSLWLIPPQFAIWVPAKTLHSIRMPRPVSMRTLYLKQGLAAAMPSQCRVLQVAPLLRELTVEIVRIGKLSERRPLHRALCELAVAQVEAASPVPLVLAMPQERRARGVADALLADLSANPALEEICARCGASLRTVQRLFRQEVGTDVETWRRQARLVKGLEILLDGRSVKEAAFTVGYRRASAFVAMFRDFLGLPPKAWLASAGLA